jgi:LPXTG-motif cell wall-anchored protein
MVTSTVLATSTIMYTSLSTQTFSTPIAFTSATVSPSGQGSQNTQWPFLLAIIPILLVILLFWRSRKKKVERTRIY